MKTIPYTRPTISKKDLLSVLEHLIDDDLSSGETSTKFEKELGKIMGIGDGVILTNSGSSALFLIFQHIGIKKGDEIILSPLSDPWIGEIIQFFSATPIWIDISVETLQMNPEQLNNKVTPQTRAIILPHHFGYPFFMNPVISSKRDSQLYFQEKFPKIKVIEDVTLGLLTRFQEHSLGSFGNYGFTCFESNRIFTTGRGGAIISKNKKIAKEIRQMRSYREKENISDETKSFKPRLDLTLSDMQAALGLSELSLVEKMIERCYQIKKFYQDSIAKGRHSFIPETEDILSNHFTFPVILQGDVQTAKKIFSKQKIEIKDIVEDTCYAMLPYLSELKNLHQLRHKVILIPIYPTLKKEEIEKITLLLNSIR